jgi:voltage-gated sodium channel
MQNLKSAVESTVFTTFIMALIILNAITLALETSPTVMASIGPVLNVFDRIVLAIFVIELTLKLIVYRWDFSAPAGTCSTRRSSPSPSSRRPAL